jgi:hypothetical protein
MDLNATGRKTRRDRVRKENLPWSQSVRESRTTTEVAMRLRMAGLAGLALLATAAPGHTQPPASAAQAWLHVRVDEPSKQGKVSVNLPLSVVTVALQAAPDTVLRNGRFRMGHGEDGDSNLSVADLRRAWAELKKTGDTEFATVEDDGEKVRVARAGDLVLVHVDKVDRSESVRVEVPVGVVDALFSAPGDELNIRAALGELQKRRGDIVRVKDQDSSVRVWIDEAN